MQNAKITVLGTLAAAPVYEIKKEIPILSMIVAGEEKLITDSGVKSQPFYIRTQVAGPYATILHGQNLAAGEAVLIHGQVEQNAWEKDGVKRSQLRVKITNGLQRQGEGHATTTDKGGFIRMKGGMNKAVITGNLGADPILRHTADGRPVTSARIAVTERYKTGNTIHEKTHWMNLNVWGEQALEMAALKKGDNITVMGALVNDSFEDKVTGAKRQVQKIEVTSFIPNLMPRKEVTQVAQQEVAAPKQAPTQAPAPAPQAAPAPAPTGKDDVVMPTTNVSAQSLPDIIPDDGSEVIEDVSFF